jgi:hypothetical protein
MARAFWSDTRRGVRHGTAAPDGDGVAKSEAWQLRLGSVFALALRTSFLGCRFSSKAGVER